MGKVIIDISVSLDGYFTGLNDGKGNGLGDGGRALHQWAFEPTEDDMLMFTESAMTLGGCILGRRTFDIAEEAWGDTPPFGESEVLVLTHRPHATLQRGATTFTFVSGGIHEVLEQARTLANGKDIALMGGEVSQQYLKAGLVDEIELHVANLLLGAGRPLFANMGDQPITLERLRVIATPTATHMRYRVVK